MASCCSKEKIDLNLRVQIQFFCLKFSSNQTIYSCKSYFIQSTFPQTYTTQNSSAPQPAPRYKCHQRVIRFGPGLAGTWLGPQPSSVCAVGSPSERSTFPSLELIKTWPQGELRCFFLWCYEFLRVLKNWEKLFQLPGTFQLKVQRTNLVGGFVNFFLSFKVRKLFFLLAHWELLDFSLTRKTFSLLFLK